MEVHEVMQGVKATDPSTVKQNDSNEASSQRKICLATYHFYNGISTVLYIIASNPTTFLLMDFFV